MSLGADRKKSGAVGLGNFEVRETSPSAGTAFESVGHLEETNLEQVADVEEIIAETGNLVDAKTKTLVHRLGTNLLQSSIDEINLPKNAVSKEFAFRYSGMMNENFFQYFCFPRGKINPSVTLGYKNGKRVLPIRAWGLKQIDASFDIPEYHLAEAKGLIRTANLQLWINPRNIHTPEAGTNKVFDISGFERHGTLNSDFLTIWQAGTPERFLRFDGVNDAAAFGNICDINNTNDVIIECWVKILAADAATAIILGRKDILSDVGLGWRILRDGANQIRFNIGDGANSCIAVGGSLLQNTWAHFACAIDRNGNATAYKNGVAGTPVSIAGVGASTPTDTFNIGKILTTFSNFELGCFRFYSYAAGALPADYATMFLNHYNAEKSYYGL